MVSVLIIHILVLLNNLSFTYWCHKVATNNFASKSHEVIMSQASFMFLKRWYQLLSFFLHLMLHSSNYNMHVEGLLPANLCLVTLLSSE